MIKYLARKIVKIFETIEGIRQKQRTTTTDAVPALDFEVQSDSEIEILHEVRMVNNQEAEKHFGEYTLYSAGTAFCVYPTHKIQELAGTIIEDHANN